MSLCLGSSTQIIWILLVITTGFVAANAPQRETYDQIVRFPLFSVNSSTMKWQYFTTVRLGNPAQELRLIVDMQSDRLWVNCPSQYTTGMRNYDLDQSSTALKTPCSGKKKRSCKFQIQYLDKNVVSGYLVHDALHFATVSSQSPINSSTTPATLASTLEFGCTIVRPIYINKYIEGVLGLGQGTNSIVEQLASHQASPRVISQCLASQGDGFIIMGKILGHDFTYTPLMSKTSYKLSLESMYASDQLLIIEPKAFDTERGTTIDAGAQVSLLAAEAYDSLIENVFGSVKESSYLGPNGFTCFELTPGTNLPDLHLKFNGGAVLTLLASDYSFQNIYDGRNGSCLYFLRETGATVLGAPVLREKIIEYDLVQSRLGWVRGECSETVEVAEIYDVGNLASTLYLSVLAVVGSFWVFLFFT